MVIKTPKRDNPPLPPSCIQKLFGELSLYNVYLFEDVICFNIDYMNIKYPNYDHKSLMATLGQKHWDANSDLGHKMMD